MGTKVTPEQVSSLTKAATDLAEAIAKRTSSTPEVEQSNAAARKHEIDNSRERANADGATRDDRVREALHVKELLDEEREEVREARKSAPRQSTLSVGEMTEHVKETLGVGRESAKGLFTKLGKERARSSERWRQAYDGREPLDLLIRGAFREVDVRMKLAGGQVATVRNFEPLTAGANDDALAAAQKSNDAVFTWVLAQQAANQPVVIARCPAWREHVSNMKALLRSLGETKALDTTDTSEWVPTGYSAQLIERYELERNLTRFIDVFVMPRNPFRRKRKGARTSVYLTTENTADVYSGTRVSTSDLADAGYDLSLIDLAVRSGFSKDLEEDSLFTVAAEVVEEMAEAWAYHEEDILVNGDTAGTHQDSDSDTAGDRRKALLGFRAYCIDNSLSTSLNTTHDADGYRAMIGSMGVYGKNARDRVWIVDTLEAAFLLTLKDTNDNPVMIANAVSVPVAAVQTIDTVGMLFGSPVVCVEAARTDLNASGVYDGVTTDNHAVICYNRRAFEYAWTNEAPNFYTQFEASYLQTDIVMHVRRDFECKFAAGQTVAWLGYNIDN